MPNRRAEIELTPAEQAAMLDAARTAILVTIGPDGVPDPTAMWFVVVDGQIVMRTYAKSQKVRNIERDPRVAVLIEDGERYDALRGLQLTGRIVLSRDVEEVLDVVAGLARKYEGVDELDRDALRDYAGKQAVMRLEVDRRVSWDHGKLAR
ncbi:MAG: TIGR03618 family F420-dependent PPOX class oxidoreductase [Frankiaceae bacterium]|nr:TIGR03618 family F420-dependent PPOX class oxidoreductase [Frankiaceae bacterium]